MRGLLQSKRKPRRSQAFAVECSCGHWIEGERRALYQRIACPYCSESVFVLPISPLPPVIDDAQTVSAASAPTRSERRVGGKDADRPLTASRPLKSGPPPTGEAVARPSMVESLGKVANTLRPPPGWLTTPKILFAGLVVMLMLVVAWNIRGRHRQELRENLLPEARRGLQALADGKLSEAHVHFSSVVRALDVLGDPIRESARFRQVHRELSIHQELLPESLMEWAVSGSLAGGTVILEGMVIPSPDGRIQFELPLSHDGRRIRVEVGQLALIRSLHLSESTHLVLGARITGRRSEGGEILIDLDSTSGVLITEPSILAAVGLAYDPDLVAAARAQRERWLPETLPDTSDGRGEP